MAQERIEIKFIPTGNVALVKAIKELDRATKKLNGELGKLNKVNIRVAQTQDLVSKRVSANTAAVHANSTAFTKLQSSVAIYRNKMLLAAFAISLFQKGVVSLVTQFSKFKDVGEGFTALTGTIQNSGNVLTQLREATDGTVDSLDLMTQANNAMLLGVVKSDKQLAKLFDTAQRLGKVMGLDTVKSIESLVTGMGRQSKLMLDNLGIMIDLDTAYQNFANANGITADSLDETQKKLAFNAEVLRVAGDMVKALGEENLSTSQHMAILSVSTAELSRMMGELLTPIAVALSKALRFLVDNLDASKLKAFSAALGTMTVFIVAQRIALVLLIKKYIVMAYTMVTFAGVLGSARIAFDALTAAMMRNVVGLVMVAISSLIGVIVFYNDTVDDAIHKTNKYGGALITADTDQAAFTASVSKSVDNLRQELLILEAENEMMAYAAKLRRDLTADNHGLTSSEVTLFNAIQKRKEELKEIARLEREQTGALDLLTNTYKQTTQGQIEHLEAQLAIVDAYSITNELTAEQVAGYQAILDKIDELVKKQNEDSIEPLNLLGEATQTQLQNLSDFFGQYAQMSQQTAAGRITDIDNATNAELQALRNTNKFRTMSATAQAAAEKKITDKAEKDKAKVRKKTNKILAAQFYIEQVLAVNSAVMNTADAYTKALTKDPTGVLATWVAGLGAAQVALIASQKPPKMRRGGYIGGKRHAQGGTLIEAERGEFIMSRNAVESVGLEAMNRINQGGGGAINVNFTGNVLSSDFIEEEAIPQIRDAIRRGADIGVG